jgi:hypothetical protein
VQEFLQMRKVRKNLMNEAQLCVNVGKYAQMWANIEKEQIFEKVAIFEIIINIICLSHRQISVRQ